MQLNNQPNWSEKEALTQQTFTELLQQARLKATPYYVYAQVILEPGQNSNGKDHAYYDGVSFRKYQCNYPSPMDPLTKRRILNIHYFAVRSFLIKANGENQIIANSQDLEPMSFPPPFYSCPNEITDAEIENFAFDAVNFISQSPNTVKQIKNIREHLCHYFIARSISCGNDEESLKLKEIFNNEAFLWKLGANRLNPL